MMILLPLALLACNREEQPQRPTEAESEQLNEADAMLDQLANEEGPEAEASSPSDRSD
ncbi:MAG: hypothetical protein LOX97_06805 [Sphingomonas sp.]|nr:hypothetical protein [Sphingomonas sp.]